MRNGYALCTEKGLATITRKLQTLGAREMDELRDLLRVGIQSGAQVTDSEKADLFVSQAFYSALPVSYTGMRPERWKSLAVLVLESAYEATLWAAVINAHRFSSNILYLTQLGGGAFGNEPQWIHDAMPGRLLLAGLRGTASRDGGFRAKALGDLPSPRGDSFDSFLELGHTAGTP